MSLVWVTCECNKRASAAPRGVRRSFAPRTRCQSLDADLADDGAYEPQRRKSNLGRHAPHLTVLSLTYCQLNPRRRNLCPKTDGRISRPQFSRLLDEIRVRGPRREFAQAHAPTQLIERRR